MRMISVVGLAYMPKNGSRVDTTPRHGNKPVNEPLPMQNAFSVAEQKNEKTLFSQFGHVKL